MDEGEGATMESVLDLYIMSLIGRSLETTYELQVHGRISLGSSSPALKRLKADGAIETELSTTGKKTRQAFRLTPLGRKRLKAGADVLLFTEPPSDIDSILRILDICGAQSAPVSRLKEFAQQARTDKAQRIKAILLTERNDEYGLEYLANRRDWDLIKLRAEIRFLSQLADSFK